MDKKNGYQVLTYRFRLYSQQMEWLYETKKIYNQVLCFYYDILQKEPDLSELSGHNLLRQLELMTIGARGQEKASLKYPFSFGKVPIYFRRAAINDAIRLRRSYLSGKNRGTKPAEQFQASPIYYKGMYKDFSAASITLKLWNGEKWIWQYCSLDTCGRTILDTTKMLSPILKINGKIAMLHVPVVEEVKDIRTIKERMEIEERVCAAAFPAQDCLAVLAILRKDYSLEKSLFIRGGKELSHKRKSLVNQIQKNKNAMGNEKEIWAEEENKHLKEKIRNLTDFYAHQVSRQIVKFCEEEQIKVFVVPHYKQAIDLNKIGYLSATNYDWIGRRIIEYLRYKAFGSGMVVTSVSTKGIAGTCHICGGQVKRYNKNKRPNKNYYGGKNFICSNGHQGNAALNSAMNIGKRFLKSQAETQG